ncbi:MAG: rhamnosyltransferase [Aeromicrobium sp.]|nr:rhamnosyltransferase [Aeromicrobium sp.]
MRISVALCTHNGERFVEEQLWSILNQRPAVAQLVISDDASADKTIEIVTATVDAYRESNSDSELEAIILVNPEPLGVTSNFEQAIAACTGELIALSDQDDVWHDGRLAVLVEPFIADRSVTLVHTDARLVDANGEPLGHSLSEALAVTDIERACEATGAAFEIFLRRNLVTGATVVFRSQLFAVARPFPSQWVHDEWLAVIAAAVGRVVLLDQETIDYRQHGSNQIGVRRPTLRYKIGRVLESRGSRNRRLVAQFDVLWRRLAGMGGAVAQRSIDLAREKAAFERTRESLPDARWRRVGPVLRARRAGYYSTFASQGNRDVIRDLLQGP